MSGVQTIKKLFCIWYKVPARSKTNTSKDLTNPHVVKNCLTGRLRTDAARSRVCVNRRQAWVDGKGQVHSFFHEKYTFRDSIFENVTRNLALSHVFFTFFPQFLHKFTLFFDVPKCSKIASKSCIFRKIFRLASLGDLYYTISRVFKRETRENFAILGVFGNFFSPFHDFHENVTWFSLMSQCLFTSKMIIVYMTIV